MKENKKKINNKPKSLVLTGLSEEYRKIAKRAAKAEHLTLAEWFEERIMNYHRASLDMKNMKNALSPMSSPWYIRLSDKLFGK